MAEHDEEYTECAVCGYQPDPDRIPPHFVLSLDEDDISAETVESYPFDGSMSVRFACSDECWLDARDQPELVTDGGEPSNDPASGEVRHHELPDGGLAVVEEFCGHVNHAVTVSAADRALYELLIEVFVEADIKTRPCLAANLACEVETIVGAAELLADIDRGSVSIGDRSYGMSITLPASRVIDSYRERPPLQLAAVGCSGSKFADPDTLPAEQRYKGAYWSHKRDYGKLADDYRIISAEHDVLHPREPIHHYDRTPDDWRGVPVDSDGRLPNGDEVGTRLDQWALDIFYGLSEWIDKATDDIDPRDVELEILLGRDYRGVLEDRGVFDALRSPSELTISFPFQEVEQAQGGMFEQIDWMGDEVADAGVATDGGVADVE